MARRLGLRVGGRARRPAGLRLTHCEAEIGLAGHVALAVYDTERMAQVREGDELCAGLAAVRFPGGELEVVPRVYRKVCTNGEVVLSRVGTDALASTGSVAEAVRACLSSQAWDRSMAALPAAARTPVLDPVEMLRRAGVEDAPSVWASREEDDLSVFGVVNALTAAARSQPRFIDRLAIERTAERILSGVESRASAPV